MFPKKPPLPLKKLALLFPAADASVQRNWNEKLVGAEGFEPPTLCSQSRCATRLRYAPTSLSIVTLILLVLDLVRYRCRSHRRSHSTTTTGMAKTIPRIAASTRRKAQSRQVCRRGSPR